MIKANNYKDYIKKENEFLEKKIGKLTKLSITPKHFLLYLKNII